MKKTQKITRRQKSNSKTTRKKTSLFTKKGSKIKKRSISKSYNIKNNKIRKTSMKGGEGDNISEWWKTGSDNISNNYGPSLSKIDINTKKDLKKIQKTQQEKLIRRRSDAGLSRQSYDVVPNTINLDIKVTGDGIIPPLINISSNLNNTASAQMSDLIKNINKTGKQPVAATTTAPTTAPVPTKTTTATTTPTTPTTATTTATTTTAPTTPTTPTTATTTPTLPPPPPTTPTTTTTPSFKERVAQASTKFKKLKAKALAKALAKK